MDNFFLYEKTDNHVLATLYVNASKIGTRIVFGLILIVTTLIVVVAIESDFDSPAQAIFPLIFVAIVGIGLPMWYLLWNLYGRECISIGRKSLSYYNDFGWFKTTPNEIDFDYLGLTFEFVRKDQESRLGRILFFDNRGGKEVTKIIHETTVLVDQESMEELIISIQSLFEENGSDRFYVHPFSDN